MWGKKHPCGLLPLSLYTPQQWSLVSLGDPGFFDVHSQSPHSSPFRLSPCKPTPVFFPDVISKVRASARTHCLHRWVGISGRRVQGGHTDHLCKVSPICLPHTDCCAFPLRRLSSSWFQAGFPTSAGASQGAGQGAGTFPLISLPGAQVTS